MNILNKISIRSLKLNKKRTISTIIGIILSTALICAVATFATSFRETMLQNTIKETGYYHLNISKVKDKELEILNNNRDIKAIYEVREIGYSILEKSQNEYKPYVELYSMDTNTFEYLKFNLIEGRFPNNSDEIVISEHIISNGKVNYKIGDRIKINVGKRITNDGYDLINANPYNKGEEKLINTKEKEFTIVGIMERPNYNFEDYSAPGYTIATTDMNEGNRNVYIALKNPFQYQSSISEILGARNYSEVTENSGNFRYDQYSINDELLNWEVLAFSLNTMHTMYAICAVVITIIIFTSVFCIRNSFAIATTEKIKMYGMFASVGATKKQIRKNVIHEAITLGLIGIPLGIACGVIASFILLKITNELIGKQFLGNINGITFRTSILAIVLSIILGFITIYLSARSSAKKASKITPIESLRNLNEIKIKNKNLKTPTIIKKLFGTGGVLAHKNLKRSKKKYKTTVISLTVSIAIFIAMNSYVHYSFGVVGTYYENYDYNVQVTKDLSKYITKEETSKIISLDKIDEKYILYSDEGKYIKIKNVEKVNIKSNLREEIAIDESTGEELFDKITGNPIFTGQKYMNLQILALDDASFKKYANKIGANYEDVRTKGILSDMYMYYYENDDNYIKERIYKYKKNDTIKGTYKNKEIEIEVGEVTDINPFGYEGSSSFMGFLIVDYDVFKDVFDLKVKRILMQSNNPDKLTEEIEKLNLDVECSNLDAYVKEQKQMIMLISIFLYGFITVITLIGVTNIFNTITSNMELRQKEFAMLKSIGMTKKEFNKMINLETILYSLKALIYGIILGLLGTLAIYKALAIKIDSGMYIPYNAILICAVFVFILVFIIMKYSINKINKQNIIETIRKENV